MKEIVYKFIIILFINERAYGKGEYRIREGKSVNFKRRKVTVYYYQSEIFDIDVHGV